MTGENKGCAYGQVNRERINHFVKSFEKFRDNDFYHLAKDVKKLGNRPSWLTAGIMIALTNLVVGLALARILGG